PPVPLNAGDPTVVITLQPGSDLGASSTDHLTSDATPTFNVVVNRAGSVSVDFDGDGSADQTQVAAQAGTLVFTSPPLPDGQRQVVATFTPTTGDPVSDSVLLTIDTVGARILDSDGGTSAGPLSTFAVHFDEPLHVATFTPADVAITVPDGGSIAATSVTGAGSAFVVHFAPQSTTGTYTFTIGPDIADVAGNPMDQDGDGANGEPTDDRFAGTVEIALQADLVVTVITAPTGLVIGNPAQAEVSWTVENQGAVETAVAQWSDRVVWSFDAQAGNADDIVVGTFAHAGALASDGTYSETRTVTLPGNLVGDFFLYVRTDALGQVTEGGGEGNNDSALAPIQVTRPFADLIVEAVSAPAAAESGDEVTVTWRARNVGVGATDTASWIDRVILSGDVVLDGSDVPLAQVGHSGALAVGANYTAQAGVRLPDGIEGDFHVFVVADATGAVFEHGLDDNNTGRTVVPIAVTLTPAPDLVVNSVTAPAASQPGETVSVTWTASNVGPGSAPGGWVDRVFLSTDGTLTGATFLTSVARSADLASAGSYTQTAAVVLPIVADGGYRLVVVTDAAGAVFEGGADDNNLAASDPLQLGHPDLAPTIVSASGVATAGTSITVEFRVDNQGTAPGLGAWVDRLLLSEDAILGPGDLVLGERAHGGPLASSGSYTDAFTVTLPIEIEGPRFLLLVTDAGARVLEPDGEGNNLAAAPIDIAAAPFADLAVSGATAPTLTIGDPARVTVGWSVTNLGTGGGLTSSWVDAVVASTDAIAGNGDDQVLATFPHAGALDVGQAYTESRSLLLPPAFQGRFTLFVRTDATGVVFEHGSEANNAAAAPDVFDVMRIPFADLTVSSVTAAPTGGSGRPLSIAWTAANQGIGATNTSAWTDSVFLASDPAGASLVATLGVFEHNGVLGVGDAYDRVAEVVLPNGIAGTFFVVVATSGPFEFVHTTNNRAVSGPVEVELTAPPDLVVTEITAPPTAVSGGRIDVTWTVRNDGTGAAAGAWVDRVVLREV
ncbi:MAG TPA: CARDB domain-containing protein, partial [Candidatus Limnocylindrales bacterium]